MQCRIPLRYHGRRSSASGLWFEPVPFAVLDAAPRAPIAGDDIVSKLPYEISVAVFIALLPPSGRGDSVRSLLDAAAVCRTWFARSRDEAVWKEAW